jgi:hypothetical protein
MPHARSGPAQIRIAAEMKPEQDDRLRRGRDWPPERPLEKLPPPEIVGEVANPFFETMRRLWWRAFDRVCCCSVLIRLSIYDRIWRPEPPTPEDLKREADRELLVRAFPTLPDMYQRQNEHRDNRSSQCAPTSDDQRQ